MPRRKAITSYKVDGIEPQPPQGGWQPASAKTNHGAFLKVLIETGKVTTETNKEIWAKYPSLQVVKPQNFSYFVLECFKAAGVDRKTKRQEEEDDTVANSSEARYLEPPQTITTDNDADYDNESIIGIGSTISHHPMPKLPPPKMDAPENNLRPGPLVTIRQMSERNSPAVLPTRIFDNSDRKGYIVVTELLHGLTAQEIEVFRDLVEADLLAISWNSRLTEAVLYDLFTSGNYNAVGDLEAELALIPTDRNLMTMQEQINTFVGARNDNPPKTTMYIRFPQNVKPSVSAWQVTYADGTIDELEGMFVAEGILFLHILRDDVDLTHVNRIRASRTPPRLRNQQQQQNWPLNQPLQQYYPPNQYQQFPNNQQQQQQQYQNNQQQQQYPQAPNNQQQQYTQPPSNQQQQYPQPQNTQPSIRTHEELVALLRSLNLVSGGAGAGQQGGGGGSVGQQGGDGGSFGQQGGVGGQGEQQGGVGGQGGQQGGGGGQGGQQGGGGGHGRVQRPDPDEGSGSEDFNKYVQDLLNGPFDPF
eukprot:scaffold25576_cov34-Cyclotella_meneghiniana.AAC.2